MKSRGILTCLVIAGACVASPAMAQDRAADVERRFSAFEANSRQEGRNLTRVTRGAASLRQDRWQSFVTPPLSAGANYLFVGYCDQHCTNAGLEVTGMWGQVVGSDFLGDANPIVSVPSTEAGAYGFRGIMKECSQGACLMEVRVYRWD
ncbi:MAG: hypothetical protein KF910_12400 [Brevundimonas sp.]|uniref:hypothetical protein n=1 Tax=Brevundimonas sp. TaxID=1871086 RepID=UPI0025BAFBC6|nr:hypothetical protein [Brevundimonas sp.]MBX3478406.1 hypothetical protein [Brevundimonas sp.]